MTQPQLFDPLEMPPIVEQQGRYHIERRSNLCVINLNMTPDPQRQLQDFLVQFREPGWQFTFLADSPNLIVIAVCDDLIQDPPGDRRTSKAGQP